MFVNLITLNSVKIPNSVTDIGFQTFYGCTNLSYLVIPDSVTNIGGEAFYGCSALKEIYYTGSEEEWKAIIIELGNNYLTGATLYYNYVSTN